MTAAELTIEMKEYLNYSPLSAVLDGKGEDERWAYNALFLLMSDKAREYLVSTQVADTIRSWVRSGLVPVTHGLAVAKLVGLAAFGDVSIAGIPELLTRIDITAEKARQISMEIERILQPIIAERAREATPEMVKLPPMTRPSENGPKPFASASTVGVPTSASRNIIDLRQKQ